VRRPPHLYLPGPWSGDNIPLAEGQVHHLERSLRLIPGNEVTYTDGTDTVGTGVWRGATVERGNEHQEPTPGSRLVLAVAPPDERSRLRFLVEKAAELGVSRLVWLDTLHRQGRPPNSAKAEAWAIGALEQSRGHRLMEIGSDLANIGSLTGEIWVADADGTDPDVPDEEVTVVVGPEAGFDSQELQPDWPRVCFARQILRVETAALAVAAWFALQHL
jgi:16S rRNA (uracil1498-N3)-methyltransferase